MGANLHVSRDWQFVKCQAALRLYGPSGPNAIKDKRVLNRRFLEALRAIPCQVREERKKEKISTRVKRELSTMLRTSHAVVRQAQ